MHSDRAPLALSSQPLSILIGLWMNNREQFRRLLDLWQSGDQS